MKYFGARRAWHDAFKDDVTAIDYTDLVDVQFTAKGADNKIMDHVEKGLIQQVIYQIKEKDRVAWAWGILAYAPFGTGHGFDRSTLLNYLWKEFEKAEGGKIPEPRLTKICMLARIAYEDAAYEDRTGQRKCRRYRQMAKLLGVDEQEYKKIWLRDFVRLKIICKDLPERALTPVADFIFAYMDIADPQNSEAIRDIERKHMCSILGVN